jgi:pantoate--beta-alanine ligase
MGYLHGGHLSLVDLAAELADFVVVSIFVNPLQFGPGEDLDTYPRDERGDLEKLRQREVDLAFLPTPDAFYPPGASTRVRVEGPLTQVLCGATRPGHFDGVATVVTRLFGLVHPTVAVFGEKDYQQLQIVRRVTEDLGLGVRIVGGSIIREADGLAMSSRNARLNPTERTQALALSRALDEGVATISRGERLSDAVRGAMYSVLEAAPGVSPVYAEVLRASDLAPGLRLERDVLLAVAARVGKTRLIDNRVIELK